MATKLPPELLSTFSSEQLDRRIALAGRRYTVRELVGALTYRDVYLLTAAAVAVPLAVLVTIVAAVFSDHRLLVVGRGLLACGGARVVWALIADRIADRIDATKTARKEGQ